jgi:hypothetical protein
MRTSHPLPQQSLPPEDRREGVRVDDRILLEYWLIGDLNHATEAHRRLPQVPLSGSAEIGEGVRLDPLIVQWMSKIEWTLEAILRTLENQSSARHIAPRLTDVNVSGEGIRFVAERPLAEGNLLDLRMVLPPFLIIEAQGEVIDARADADHVNASVTVVVRFSDISEDDREKIIRYVVQRQAELQRRRQKNLR